MNIFKIKPDVKRKYFQAVTTVQPEKKTGRSNSGAGEAIESKHQAWVIKRLKQFAQSGINSCILIGGIGRMMH